MAGDGAQEDFDGQGHNPFMVHHARVWSRASTGPSVPGGSAAIQCFNFNFESNQKLYWEKDLTS